MTTAKHSKKTLAALLLVIAIITVAIVITPGRMIDIASVPIGVGTGSIHVVGKATQGLNKSTTQNRSVAPRNGTNAGEVCRLPADRNMCTKTKLL